MDRPGPRLCRRTAVYLHYAHTYMYIHRQLSSLCVVVFVVFVLPFVTSITAIHTYYLALVEYLRYLEAL